MTTFHNTITITRPADEVFAFLADFGNIPAWNHAIARTVQTSPGPARVGATYRQTRTIPHSSEEAFEITDFAPPSRLAVKGQIGPFHTTSSYLLEPTTDGTRLINTVELEPSPALLRPLGPLAVPAVKAAVARNLGTLKQLLEGTRPTSERDQP
jgi:Polyketide cyclase / dehydrase and lipid transport